MKLALARRYRPRTFQTMVGQEVTLRALMNALDSKRLHHAYLFTGTRGVGKTSIARILAKSLNCERGISSTPCGECKICQAIDQGNFVDLIEVDAASRTKVEDTRELLDNVQYLPTQGRFKIYLIDEVHMLSGHSFNALLKTLEEPPEHVKFLLATTDPQKLPATILSRCLQFHLWRVPFDKMVAHLGFVLQQEGVAFEEEALRIIARAAEGSLRDALSLLEQAISFSQGSEPQSEQGLNQSLEQAQAPGRVAATTVRAMLGLSAKDGLIALLRSLASGDARTALQTINTLAERAPDFAGLLTEFLSMIHHIAIAQRVPEALEENLESREALLVLAGSFTPEEIQLYYQIGLHGQRDLPYAPTPKVGFEMTVLRMIAFQPVRIANVGETKGDVKTQPKVEASPVISPIARITKPEQLPVQSKEEFKPIIQAVETVNPLPKAIAPVVPSPETTPDWKRVISDLNLSGLTKVLAENCVVSEWTENLIQLTLDDAQKPLYSKRYEDRLKEALGQYLGRTVNLKILQGAIQGETPAVQTQRQTAETREATHRLIEGDPNIQQLIQSFGARIEHVEVKEE